MQPESEPQESALSGWAKARREEEVQRQAESEAGRIAESTRRAAGMGFWRLVGVVACGILLAQVVSGAVGWVLLRFTTAP